MIIVVMVAGLVIANYFKDETVTFCPYSNPEFSEIFENGCKFEAD